jgi:hypothetical protein
MTLSLLGQKKLKTAFAHFIVAKFLLARLKKFLPKPIELCGEARTLCCSC